MLTREPDNAAITLESHDPHATPTPIGDGIDQNAVLDVPPDPNPPVISIGIRNNATERGRRTRLRSNLRENWRRHEAIFAPYALPVKTETCASTRILPRKHRVLAAKTAQPGSDRSR